MTALTTTQELLLNSIDAAGFLELPMIDDWMLEDNVQRDQLNILEDGQLILDLRELRFRGLIQVEEDMGLWIACLIRQG